MKNKAKLVILVFAALFAGLIFWAVKTVPQGPETVDAPTESKAMKYTNNTMHEDKNGVKVWEMTAEEINVDPDTNNVILKNISGKFYQENGTVITLKAPQAFYETEAKNINIDGGVTAKSSDGTDISAQKFSWDGSSATFQGTGDVKITKEDLVAVGDKIESKDGFQNFKLMGNAHLTKGRAQ
jgi:Protein of unknown function (DUF1239).